jgi:hypothetical protein
MALQKQPVNINFGQGVETKSDPWQIPIGKFLQMRNSTFQKGMELTKRFGFPKYPQTIGSSLFTTFPAFSTSIAKGRAVATFQDELLALDGKNLFSFSDSDNEWFYRGRAETVKLSTKSVEENKFNHVTADCAVNEASGLKLYAWLAVEGNPLKLENLNYTGVQFSLLDVATGQNIIDAASTGDVDISSRPRCVALGSALFLFWMSYDGATMTLKAAPITSSGIGGITSIVTDVSTAGYDTIYTLQANYDVAVNDSSIYVAYNATGTAVNVLQLDATLATVNSATKAESASNGVGLFFDSSDNVWVAYGNGTAVKSFIMSANLGTTVLAPTNVDAGATGANTRNVTGIHNGTLGVILYDQLGVPTLGPAFGISTTAGFTVPAVGSDVTITIPDTDDILPFSGQQVYIQGAGYYQIGAIASATTFFAENLGFTGNAAPTTVIASGKTLTSVYAYMDAKINFNTLTSGGTVGTAQIATRSSALASRAFLQDSIAHFIGANDANLQPTYFVFSLFNLQNSGVNAHISAKIAQSEAGSIPYCGVIPSVNLLADGTFEVALGQQSALFVKSTDGIYFSYRPAGVISVNLDFAPLNISSQSLGNNLMFGLARPLMYDGSSVVEHGFNLYPENVVVSLDGGTGDLSTGSYGYQVVYTWIDNQGQTHRSAPSPVVTFSATAGNLLSLKIPTLRLTEKFNVTIDVYRTAANGTTYYSITPYGTLQISNSTTVDSVTLLDGSPDSAIIGNPQLYTTGEVENIAAPAVNSFVSYKNRMFYISAEQPTIFGYSKEVIAGTPVEFNDAFIKDSGSVGGGLTAIGLIDDKLILFKNGSIYFIVGNGPAASGTNNDFSEPYFITSDVGNVDQLSVVVMPLGLMFKSDKGIYLLDRNLTAQYIGADVEGYNSLSVRTSLLMRNNNEVRFHLSDGTVLVYDYFYQQWNTYPSLSAVSSTIYDNQHVFINSTGEVYQQEPNTYADGSSNVNMYFETGWINVAGLQGYERIYFMYLLAKYYSAHTVTIGIAYDYDDTIVQSTTFTADSTESVEQWRIFFSRQKCEAFKITFTETTSAAGKGLSVSGINLVVGLKDMKPKLKAARSVG